MMAKPSTPTKAELHEMLAEAVRNTQPQPPAEPVRNTQPQPPAEPVRNTQPGKTRSAPKRTAKIKSVRRKPRPR